MLRCSKLLMYQRQSRLQEESELGYEAAKLMEDEEKRKERQQLEDDQRMAELLSQEFILQQIVSLSLPQHTARLVMHINLFCRKEESVKQQRTREWLKN